MQTNWRIGTLFEIPLFLDPLWFLVATLATINFGTAYMQWGPVLAWSAGLLMALLLFGSVLLHELGHSLVARQQGIKVNSITLFFFGGIASIEEESKTPGQAFQVAIAGPTVSIALSVLLTLLSQVLPGSSPASVMAADLAKINLVVALFNLIPGLPLDGGQVLKAALWKVTGNRFQAVHWAARTGQILGYCAIALGIAVDWFTGQLVNGLWIVLLGWFGIRNSSAYDRMTTLQEALLELVASNVINKDFRVVDADYTLRQFADLYLLEAAASAPQVYFAASDGRYRGMVSVDDLRLVERSQWESQTLHNILHPLTEIPTVAESTPLVEVINQLEQLSRITVLSAAGAVAGLIDRGDIVQAVAKKLNLGVTDAEIKRVKEEGSYPRSLQLNILAKQLN